MRTLIFAFMIAAAGCAGTPPDRGPSVLAPAAAAPQKADQTSPVVEFADSPGKITRERLASAKKMGYSLVNEHGEDLYCRQDLKTGSRVQREMVCLTWKDLETLREQTQNGLANTMRQLPPPAGR